MDMGAQQHEPSAPPAARASRAEDRRLMLLHRDGDSRARDALIERHLSLARNLALRYRRAAEPLDDLYQVASVGLIKAVDRWDPDRGYAFSSYAVPTILGELRRYFRDTTWAVRPPRDLLELTMTVERTRRDLGAAIGREPTADELAEHLGRPTEAVLEAVEAAGSRCAASLDGPVLDDAGEGSTVGDQIGGEDHAYQEAEARATVERLTKVLDARAREILRLRFEEDLLQAEIAERMGCSQMQVCRVIRSSLERLNAYAGGGEDAIAA
jgi:RNA polymerase sigma-B factor